MDLSDNLMLDLVKLGFLGRRAHLRDGFHNHHSQRVRDWQQCSPAKRFLTFGFAAFGIAALVQILPLFLGASVSLTFSPDFPANQLPIPKIVMGEQELKMDKVYPIAGSRTVKINVDEVLNKVKTL